MCFLFEDFWVDVVEHGEVCVRYEGADGFFGVAAEEMWMSEDEDGDGDGGVCEDVSGGVCDGYGDGYGGELRWWKVDDG